MNFMRQNVFHDVFRARMALGSWVETLLLPDTQEAVKIIEENIEHGKNK